MTHDTRDGANSASSLLTPAPTPGQRPSSAQLVDVDALIDAYHALKPDPEIAAQRVAFGTSGHRGSAFERSFNADHVLAITQALCEYRARQAISGPLFIGIDTHALSLPAFRTAMEVLAANGVETMIAANDAPTPTPTVSHAILRHNDGRRDRLADGIVITPSHNPPHSGGYKYNPPHGGPAGGDITALIEARANELLEARLVGVKRMVYEAARRASTRCPPRRRVHCGRRSSAPPTSARTVRVTSPGTR